MELTCMKGKLKAMLKAEGNATGDDKDNAKEDVIGNAKYHAKEILTENAKEDATGNTVTCDSFTFTQQTSINHNM